MVEKGSLSKLTQWRWAALLAFVVMLVLNGLAGSTTLLGGMNTAQISDSQPNLFAPAGFTFLIWGVIYVLLGTFLLRAFGVTTTEKPHLKDATMVAILQWFTLSSVINSAWIFAWQYEIFWLSVVAIVVLLVVLIKIVTLLDMHAMSARERWLVRVPFGVYFGWITVATIANIVTWLVSIGFDGGGLSAETWTVALLLAGAIIVTLRYKKTRDIAYTVTVLWAYMGIAWKHMSSAGFDGAYPVVITVSLCAVVYFALLSVRALDEQTRATKNES